MVIGTYRDWFLLAPGVQVTEPDLHLSVRPGGAEGVGGQHSVRAHPVPPLGLGHQPVEHGGIPQKSIVGGALKPELVDLHLVLSIGLVEAVDGSLGVLR